MTITKSLNLGLLCACFCAAMMVPLAARAAVTKCVNLNPSMTCTHENELYHIDWSIVCGPNVGVLGVGMCSSTAGSTVGQKANYLETNSENNINNINANIYCWCRMISPAVSKWVFSGSDSSATRCSEQCTLNCTYDAFESPEFRAALFSDIGA